MMPSASSLLTFILLCTANECQGPVANLSGFKFYPFYSVGATQGAKVQAKM